MACTSPPILGIFTDLAHKLKSQTEFSADDWNAFQITDLKWDDYICCDGVYWQPKYEQAVDLPCTTCALMGHDPIPTGFTDSLIQKAQLAFGGWHGHRDIFDVCVLSKGFQADVTEIGIWSLVADKSWFLNDYMNNVLESEGHVQHGVDWGSVHPRDGSLRFSQRGNQTSFLGIQDTNTNSRVGTWSTLMKIPCPLCNPALYVWFST